MNKNIFTYLVIVVTAIIAIAAFAMSYDSQVAVQGDKGDKGDQGIQGIQGEQGIRGIQGIQGIQGILGIGIQGLKGDKGDKGDIGIAGTTPVIDLNSLASKVEKLLDEDNETPYWSTSGTNGNYAPEFSIGYARDYTFTFTHFGADEFEVSLVDADGIVTVLLNSDGHLQMTKTIYLSQEVYTLRVSATGSWIVSLK